MYSAPANKRKTACVLGLGRVGLPTAILLAESGYDVVGVDVDRRVVDAVVEGSAGAREPGLPERLRKALERGGLQAAERPTPADVFLICVPTALASKGTADLSCVASAVESVASAVRPGSLLILESTVPVGTTAGLVCSTLTESGLRPGHDVHVAFCPERVLPGDSLREIVWNDRVVGGLTPASTEAAKQFYQAFAKGEIHCTNAPTAEFTKLAENAYRDLNIAFANELAVLAERHGVDIWTVRKLASRHPRVTIHRPGAGVGGHCIPVDPLFLVQDAPELGRLISCARQINDEMPLYLADRIASDVDAPSATIAVLGVAYKPDVDDARNSPALALIRSLLSRGFEVVASDPLVTEFHYPLRPLEEAIGRADCIVFVTHHSLYRAIDPLWLRALSPARHIFAAVEFLDKRKWADAGFQVRVLGQPE